jgi:hypothetical protein
MMRQPPSIGPPDNVVQLSSGEAAACSSAGKVAPAASFTFPD